MWITSRTPYLEQAERIAALTTQDDIWLLVSARGPARTVVAIGPKTIVCDGGDVAVYDAPADIPQADLTRDQHLTLEHFDDLVRGWYAVNHMPYRLAALVQPYWGSATRDHARSIRHRVESIWDAEDWPALPLLEPDPTG
jgi:hypothetical protein